VTPPGVRAAVAVAALLLLCVADSPAAAADATLRAEVNADRLGIEDQLQLTITLEGGSISLLKDLEPPALTNLRLVAGPSVSTQISIVNGSFSQSRIYTFVLQPTAIGRATIGPVRATLPGGDKTTASITIEVVAGSILPAPGRAADTFAAFMQENPFGAMPSRRAPVQARVFVEATASRTRIYVGEPVVLTYYLYTQASISGLDFLEAPKFSGFWTEEFPRETQPRAEAVQRDGQPYTRFAVFRKLLFPTRSGTLTVPPSTFKIGVAPQGGFFFDPTAGAGSVVTRSTGPVILDVEAVPAGEGFSGAVGSFTTSATIDRRRIGIGEAATVRFRIDGTGNLKWIDKPPALAIPGAKVYPPQLGDDLKVTTAGITGSKTWEYVVVGETGGPHEAPPLPFSYFDPASRHLRTLTTAALPFEVEGGPSAPAASAPTTPAGVPGLRLRGAPATAREAATDLAGGTLAGCVLVALLAHATLATWTRVGRRERAHRPQGLRAALADLRRVTAGGVSKEAAAAVMERVLIGQCGDPAEPSAALGDAARREAQALLDQIRFVRYAPQLGEYGEKIRELAARTDALVRRLE
jgi:hypothetical protein